MSEPHTPPNREREWLIHSLPGNPAHFRKDSIMYLIKRGGEYLTANGWSNVQKDARRFFLDGGPTDTLKSHVSLLFGTPGDIYPIRFVRLKVRTVQQIEEIEETAYDTGWNDAIDSARAVVSDLHVD